MTRKTEQRKPLNPDEMLHQAAGALVRIAIRALMNMGVDRETAGQWIVSAVKTIITEDHD